MSKPTSTFFDPLSVLCVLLFVVAASAGVGRVLFGRRRRGAQLGFVAASVALAAALVVKPKDARHIRAGRAAWRRWRSWPPRVDGGGGRLRRQRARRALLRRGPARLRARRTSSWRGPCKFRGGAPAAPRARAATSNIARCWDQLGRHDYRPSPSIAATSRLRPTVPTSPPCARNRRAPSPPPARAGALGRLRLGRAQSPSAARRWSTGVVAAALVGSVGARTTIA